MRCKICNTWIKHEHGNRLYCRKCQEKPKKQHTEQIIQIPFKEFKKLETKSKGFDEMNRILREKICVECTPNCKRDQCLLYDMEV